MFDHLRSTRRALMTVTLLSASFSPSAFADGKSKAKDGVPRGESSESIVVLAHRTSRSAVSISGNEMQKLLPGINPLKALETLPGVVYQTADPWGNNEQNISLYIHGFNQQQLGYTLDGVPLGDQNYGNYNGLSPQRAIISENVSQVTLSSGAGDLGTASTSNLGGTIDTFSSDPKHRFGGTIGQSFGSFSTFRTYARIDTGDFGNGNAGYMSFARQDARAWDFAGHQGGYQVNAKFVHDAGPDRIVGYFDWSNKVEPNEDSTVHVAGEKSAPYTRPFLFPDFNAALNYLGANGATPASAGSNYRNYYSDAQRTDYLGYLKWDHRFNDHLHWANQIYYHHDDGAGVVAGPISAAGLPALFDVYFPGQNLRRIFGNSGYATRTTEYVINRGGYLTALDWTAGRNTIEVGAWVEQNNSTQYRRWYPLFASNPSSPYRRPTDPLITQYASAIDTTEFQTHIDDRIQVTKDIVATAGFKSSMQFADGRVPVQPKAGSLAGSSGLPVGSINTTEAFLPEFGLTWNVTKSEQLFANIQRNARQYMTYGAGGLSPWSLGSQQAFDLFRQTGQPETSWTYETGLRSQHRLNLGWLTGFEGQAEYYHVSFANRLLGISPTPVISSIIGGAAIIANVGSVTTDGVDLAGTLHFGPHVSVYDAISYNSSRYDDDYTSGTALVRTAGRRVPGTPDWMNKSVISTNWGNFDAQLTGDYLGKRYATYTNDLAVKSTFMLGLQAGYRIDLPQARTFLRDIYVQGNITNLNNQRGVSTVVIGAASGTYNTFPIAPRMYFMTVSAHF